MKEVLVAGAFAIVAAVLSGWLVEGGLKRRSRRRIREELELAELVGVGEYADALRASAHRRLDRYTTPLRGRISKSVSVGLILPILGGLVAAATVVVIVAQHRASVSDAAGSLLAIAIAALIVGAVGGAGFVITEFGLEPLLTAVGRVTTSGIEPVHATMVKVIRSVDSLVAKLFGAVEALLTKGPRLLNRLIELIRYGRRGQRRP